MAIQFPNIQVEFDVYNTEGVKYHSGAFWLDCEVSRRACAERFTESHLSGHEIRTRMRVETPEAKKARLKAYASRLNKGFRGALA